MLWRGGDGECNVITVMIPVVVAVVVAVSSTARIGYLGAQELIFIFAIESTTKQCRKNRTDSESLSVRRSLSLRPVHITFKLFKPFL